MWRRMLAPHLRAVRPGQEAVRAHRLSASRRHEGQDADGSESLVLWHWHHVDRGPRSIRRGDADHAVVFFDHLPAEDPAPEVGDHTWLDGVDRDGRYATGHAAILRESGADRGYDARECSDFVRASRADNQASSDSHRQLGGARGRVRSRAGGTRTHDPRIMSTYSCNAVLTRVFPART